MTNHILALSVSQLQWPGWDILLPLLALFLSHVVKILIPQLVKTRQALHISNRMCPARVSGVPIPVTEAVS